jgi:hypothetical protein
MAVYAKKRIKKDYELAPEGQIDATLIEVRDLGNVSTMYGAKPALLFVWETNLTGKDGDAIQVREQLNNTLHPMGRLAPRIKQITGEQPDDSEDFDVSALEGTKAQLIIEHSVPDEEGRRYANIAAVVRYRTEAEKKSEERVARVINKVKKQSPVPF